MTLNDFVPKHDYLICVDSDGCAVDTMDIKHKRCFGPCMIREWDLEQWEKPIQERWNEINLYSRTRGINRFKGLAMALAEINDRYKPIEGIEELLNWTEQAPELSNAALATEAEHTGSTVLKKALSWSEHVNQAINGLSWKEKKAFSGVQEAFQAAKDDADIVIVSSANRDAVEEEWKRFGLLDLVDLILCQDAGSKAYCLSELKKKGYPEAHVLMCGDAPGDENAAEVNHVLYWPILVSHEEESWRLFREEALPLFLNGQYEGAYQQKQKDVFHSNLGF